MSIFERYLSVFIAAAIILGVTLGAYFPIFFQFLAELEIANVNLIIAVLIWLMIYPMMLQIDFTSVIRIGREPQGLYLTLVINWLIKPFTMAALGVLFFEGFFSGLVDPNDAKEYIAGMILLGVAPCTAMVFVWSHLTNGDPNYTLVQVSVNNVIMTFAYAPIVALLLGMTDMFVPWKTLLLSVVLYIVLPLLAGIISRRYFLTKGAEHLANVLKHLKPYSVVGLIATVVFLFSFQATRILTESYIILLIAIPLILQTYGIFILALVGALLLKLRYSIAAPATLIGTSNFFELAVAVAISLFGVNSGAALATVVGVLVEVPVMLSLVWFLNRQQHWFNHHPSS